ncbi:MAG: response regulator [Candidatus Omnitrophica bacterium]|nr:response regulator [Candidatus Omnitrophota bacterium]
MASILIVDDERGICEEFKDLLEDEGHQVDIALSGRDAIALVREKEHHLVFLDVLLPKMEGRQIYEEIRKIKTALPVVFMSGYLPPNMEKEALQLGAKACLRKPLDIEQVKKIIGTCS